MVSEETSAIKLYQVYKMHVIYILFSWCFQDTLFIFGFYQFVFHVGFYQP